MPNQKSFGTSTVGPDDRRYTKAIPGYTGHSANAKDFFGFSSGKFLERDAAGELNVSVRKPGKAAGSSFMSPLGNDGAIWDHNYTTTNKAMNEGVHTECVANSNASPHVVGYTGHVHMSQDVLGACHDQVVRISQNAREEQLANLKEPSDENSKPHWTSFFNNGTKKGGGWKQQYTQTLTNRPNPRQGTLTSDQEQAVAAKQQKAVSDGLKASQEVLGTTPKKSPTSSDFRRKFAQMEEEEETLDMGPAPMFLYNNTLNTNAPEDEEGYTGHFSSQLPSKHIVGYTGHLHGSHATIGMNYGRVERRTNPYKAAQEEPHPLGNRYQNAPFPSPPTEPAIRKMISMPSKPKKSGVPIVDAVRTKIMQRGGRTGFRGLTRVLRIMDDDGNRKLNRYELQGGLNTYGIHPNQQELDELMIFFDRDGSGQVTVTEFMRALRGDMSAKRRELVMQAYGMLDATCDGQVTMDDMKQLYDTSRHPEVLSGEKAAKEVLLDFMKGWDKNGDGEITKDEFCDYYSDISAGIDNDQYFELMIRNAWHLSGGEGAAANTSCRRVLVIHMDGRQTVEEVKNDLGIGPNDMEKIYQKLVSQGVTDIKNIQLM